MTASATLASTVIVWLVPFPVKVYVPDFVIVITELFIVTPSAEELVADVPSKLIVVPSLVESDSPVDDVVVDVSEVLELLVSDVFWSVLLVLVSAVTVVVSELSVVSSADTKFVPVSNVVD